MTTKIAIIGCGFVADYYMSTLLNHPDLELVGATDIDQTRAADFGKNYSVHIYSSVEELLADDKVEIVLNLTNPRSHFAVSWECLQANKHVYSEKPLAVEIEQAEKLVALAKEKELYIASAPCNVLGETAQTIWKALRENVVGTPRVVYAEMDDGMVHQMRYDQWLSINGIPWPYKDEFEVGCTLEHAGYYVTWLTAFFGPAESLSSFSDCTIPDKQTDVVLEPANTPDFSVACIKFASGVVARLTCGIVAPHDHHLKIVGDKGILTTEDSWDYHSPVYFQDRITIRRKTLINPIKRKYPLVRKAPFPENPKRRRLMDYGRGVADMAESIKLGIPNRLSADYSLHVNEIVLAIQNPVIGGYPYKLKSTFEPMQPMPWAK